MLRNTSETFGGDSMVNASSPVVKNSRQRSYGTFDEGGNASMMEQSYLTQLMNQKLKPTEEAEKFRQLSEMTVEKLESLHDSMIKTLQVRYIDILKRSEKRLRDLSEMGVRTAGMGADGNENVGLNSKQLSLFHELLSSKKVNLLLDTSGLK